MNCLKINLLFSLLLVLLSSCKETETKKDKFIELPVSRNLTTGTFSNSLGGESTYKSTKDTINNPWQNLYLDLNGVPKNWNWSKLGDINTNYNQSVYQGFYQGKVDINLKNEILANEDTTFLTKKNIKTSVGFVYGEDEHGNLKIILDQNNNLDFSDDEILDLKSFKDFTAFEDDKENEAIQFQYERLLNGEIIPAKGKVYFCYNEAYNMLFSSFIEHGLASFKNQKIEVYGNNLSYSDTKIFLVNEEDNLLEKPSRETLIQKDGYLILNDQLYKNHGVNPNKDMLVLEKMEGDTNHFKSAQVGFMHFPIEGNNFLTQEPLTTTNLTSDYTLLDFWATWCGPCIQEMPYLDSLYQKTTRKEFEIIGLVGDSNEEDLIKSLNKLNITWPHLFLSENHPTLLDYAIKGYPTNYLIDANGKIVAKNLRGEQLEEKIFKLLGEK
ncbi:MAG: TlpA family protein disulfide reductase [Flavobacteriaceae bacterium]|nr:TlpA family protein disulfide reductase [Flavobacteriaceae bacterium]